MAVFTRVNPVAGAGSGYDHGENYSTSQITAIEIDAGASLAAKDAIGSTIETIVREFSPLMYQSTGTAGKIFMICDGHAVDAASMTIRLQALGTVDSIVLTSATVVARDLDGFVATT